MNDLKMDIQLTIKKILNIVSKNKKVFNEDELKTIASVIKEIRSNSILTYEELKKFELKLNKYISRVWVNSLTDFENFSEDKDFKLLVTCPTKKSSIYEKEEIISTSLITSKHLGTYNNIPYFIVCSISEDNILGISENDMNSLYVDDQSDYNSKYFYLNDSHNKRIFSKKYVSNLKTPDEVESYSIDTNIVKNGNILLRTKSVYSDILLDGDKTNFLGLIILEPCSTYEKNEAMEIAKKFNLKVKTIDYIKYCERFGVINSNNVNKKKIYNLTDIKSIFYVIHNIEEVKNEYNNLFIQEYNGTYKIISDDDISVMYYKNDNKFDIILKNDSRLIRVDLNDTLTYSIENNIVGLDNINEVLKKSR